MRNQHFTFKQIKPLVRASLVVIILATAVSGVTFAALQSTTVAITNNTISTGTAKLMISSTGSTYSSTSIAGFDFGTAVPGGAAVPTAGNTFYLRNSGTVPLGLKMYLSTAPINTGAVDLTKVNLILTRLTDGEAHSFNLAALAAAADSGGLNVGETLVPVTGSVGVQFKLQASMAADAYKGAGADISDIDIVIGGATTAN